MTDNASEILKILSDISGRLEKLEVSVGALSDASKRHDKANYLDHSLISDYTTHGIIPSAERWERIRVFENTVRGLKELYDVGNDTVMCRVLGRYWMLFSGSDGYVAKHIMAHGYWELSSTELVASEVKPGMRVVDAGANIGYYSVLMGDKIGPDGFMYVFEPTPKLHKNLDDMLFLNGLYGRYKLIKSPLWSTPGQNVRFVIPVGDTKNASVLEDTTKANEYIDLTTTTLDEVVPAGQSIDFMKIDVEGAEQQMWVGMKRVLRDSPTVRLFLEFNAARLQEPGTFIDMITADGFKLAFLDPVSGYTTVSKDRLLSHQFGEDWMLVLGR